MKLPKNTKILLIVAVLFLITTGAVYIFVNREIPNDSVNNNQASSNENKENMSESTELFKNAEQIIQGLITPEAADIKPQITIIKATDNHIKANIFLNPGEGYILAAKVGGEWKKILEGNGIPRCSEIDPYGFPEDIAPGCIDENNNIRKNEWKLIKNSIANCEVEKVMQNHSQYVFAKLKDGRLIEGSEPAIDDIINLAIEAQGKCGKIIMATE